jgi:hypothetical protein
MAFSRDDLTVYESKPQVDSPNFDPWEGKSHPPEPQVEAVASTDPSPEDVAPPDVQAVDGSTTEPEAEPVAATSATLEGDKDPDLEELADGKPRSRAQERIEELVAERNALRKYGEYLLSQVESSRKAPKGEQESRPVAAEVNDELAPTLESADYDPVKLNTLQNEWIQKQVDKRVNSAVRQIEVRQSEVAIRQAFDQRTAEFKKTTPDFDTILANPALPQLAPEAARVVIKSENGPAIAYHLGRNPDLAERIARMDAVDQAAAIGRLEGQLTKVTQKEPSTTTKAPVKVASVTKAPPPPKPVSGGTSPVQKDSALMSMEDWVANERSKKLSERSAKLKLRQSLR